METYQELKKRQHDEFGAFEGIFWAFSNDQFSEGLNKLGITKEEAGAKLYSIGAGGYMLRSVSQAFHAMRKRHDAELKALKEDEKELIEAIVYQLGNHEYCITGDVTDALDALGLTRDTVSPEMLKKAVKKHNEGMVNV